MDIVFITVDCLRSDHLEERLGDTPHLDEFIEDSLFYPGMYATTTTTTPSVASFFTGLYSEKNGVMSLSEVGLEPEVKTLAEILKENGFRTFAYVTGPLKEETGLGKGFSEYYERDQRTDLFTEWGREINSELEEILSGPEDNFIYIHLWELHGKDQGYLYPPKEFDSGEYGETIYTRTLSALDRKLGELLEAIPDDTSLVITGDHGESITFRRSELQKWVKRARTLFRYHIGIDTRKAERAVNNLFREKYPDIEDHYIEEEHGEATFDFASNVPFAIRSPRYSFQKIDAQVRQVDIFPTILDLAGIEPDVDYEIDGKTLLPPKEVENRVCYMRSCGAGLKGRKNWMRSIRKEGWKYMEFLNRDWKPELYNLKDDPSEMINVYDENREMAEMLANEFPEEELEEKEESEVIKEKLKDLGYIS